ncbi:MAG: hypothetical protein ACFHHU_04010 [Porticoccaceae bacterium]
MNNLAKAVATFVAFLMTACASSRYSELYEFYPVETKTDSKLFRYQFILQPGERDNNSRAAAPPGFVVSFEDMRRELEKYMAENPYCTRGYFVYDEIFDGNKYTLLGECQESK